MHEQMHTLETFDLIFTKDDVTNKKLHLEIFNKVINYYNAKKDEYLILVLRQVKKLEYSA